MTTRLVCTEGSSSKFWEGRVEGATLQLRWGKIGTNAQTKDKAFPDAASAERELQKMIAEKMSKGYVHDEAGAAGGDVRVPAPTPVETATASQTKPKKKSTKKGAVGVKAAGALMAKGDAAGIMQALATDPGSVETFAQAGMMKLFDRPKSGVTPEEGQSRKTALRALLQAGLEPSLVGYMIAATSWVLDSSEKIELLGTHWNALDAGAKKQIVNTALWVPDDALLVDFVIGHADAESLLGFLGFSPLTNLGIERGSVLLAKVVAVVSRFTAAELDQLSDQQVYATWLMDSRDKVYNDHFGCGLIHKAAGGAVPALLTTLLDRRADAKLRTTQPSKWTLPDSTSPAKSGEYAVIELPAGATALDLAVRCYEQMNKLDAKYASACDSLTGSDKLRCERNRATQVATLQRYRDIVGIFESRGLTADPTRPPAPKFAYDVDRALEQYLSLCEAIGQDVAAARAKSERIEAPTSIVAYWRELAEDNKSLLARLQHDGLLGLLFDSKEFYDDSVLSGEAANVASQGERLHSVDADAWYDVNGVIYRVHPEGCWKVGTYEHCMGKLRDTLTSGE